MSSLSSSTNSALHEVHEQREDEELVSTSDGISFSTFFSSSLGRRSDFGDEVACCSVPGNELMLEPKLDARNLLDFLF